MAHSWRVEPAGVAGVLRAARASATPIPKAVRALTEDASTASTGASSSIVSAALHEALQLLGTRLDDAQTHAGAVLEGTAQAGTAIVHGDQEMAGLIVGEATGALSETDVLRRLRSRSVR